MMLSFSLKKLFIFITLICIILFLSQHIGFQVYYKPAKYSSPFGEFAYQSSKVWDDAIADNKTCNQFDIHIWWNNNTILNIIYQNQYRTFDKITYIWIKWVYESE